VPPAAPPPRHRRIRRLPILLRIAPKPARSRGQARTSSSWPGSPQSSYRLTRSARSAFPALASASSSTPDEIQSGSQELVALLSQIRRLLPQRRRRPDTRGCSWWWYFCKADGRAAARPASCPGPIFGASHRDTSTPPRAAPWMLRPRGGPWSFTAPVGGSAGAPSSESHHETLGDAAAAARPRRRAPVTGLRFLNRQQGRAFDLGGGRSKNAAIHARRRPRRPAPLAVAASPALGEKVKRRRTR
jgi:hypothetical protein